MIPQDWFLRKTTHGVSSVAHLTWDNWLEDGLYTVLICNISTKHRVDKLVSVNSEYPKKCPLCLKKVSELVRRRLQGSQADVYSRNESILTNSYGMTPGTFRKRAVVGDGSV